MMWVICHVRVVVWINRRINAILCVLVMVITRVGHMRIPMRRTTCVSARLAVRTPVRVSMRACTGVTEDLPACLAPVPYRI